EIVIPEVGGIDDDILLTIDHDALRKKLLNVNLLISKIETLNANPTPSSDCKTKSSSTFLNSLLEETNTFDNSLPKSDSYEFTDELIPFISAPEYDCFRFMVEPNSRDFTKDVVENLSPTKEQQTEDIIFDPGICKYHFSKPDISHRYGAVHKFNTYRSHLNTYPMLIYG
nr:hypothetical protein [Tanacetum cinerariifolium]